MITPHQKEWKEFYLKLKQHDIKLPGEDGILSEILSRQDRLWERAKAMEIFDPKIEARYQVCSMSLSLKLRDLGLKQKSLFYWMNTDDDEFVVGRQSPDFDEMMETNLKDNRTDWCSAPTSHELKDILPDHIYTFRFIRDGSRCWGCCDSDTLNSRCYPHQGHSECEETEEDALAEMLIWLIENGKVKI
jgi:hypothetical protein